MKYIHKETSLGTIVVKGNGLEVDCVVTVTRMPARGPTVEQAIEYSMYNMTTDHAGGMQPLIDAALAKGKSLADAYIAARENQSIKALQPKDLSQRTTIFACGRPAGCDDTQREFEVYVQDLCDPSERRVTIAINVGTTDERHVVIPASDTHAFLSAMADLHATPFTHRTSRGEAA